MSDQQPGDEIEHVTGVVEPDAEVLPAVTDPGGLQGPRPLPSPAVQAAAVAAGGLMAGAVTVAAVRRVRTHGLPSLRRSRRARKAAPIVASRSFLVDIHLLDREGG